MADWTYEEAVDEASHHKREFVLRRAAWPAHIALHNNFGSASINDITGCGAYTALTAEDLAGIDWDTQATQDHCAALDAARAVVE